MEKLQKISTANILRKNILIKIVLIIFNLINLISSNEIELSRLCEIEGNSSATTCVLRNLHFSILSPPDVLLKFTHGNSTGTSKNTFFEGLIILDSHFAEVPPVFNYQNKIKQFVMNNCHLQTVKQAKFEQARSIQSLVLNSNEVEELPDKVFYYLVKLEDLRLSNNRIFRLYTNTFFGCGKVKYLDLSLNIIRKLPDDVLTNLLSLEYIDLSSNRIERFDSSTFENNYKLKTILLQNNRIVVFEMNTLKHFPHLYNVDLSFNSIEDVYLQRVDILKMNNCGLKECHINGSVQVIEANNNNLLYLDVVNKESIIHLQLHNNFMTTLENFEGMTNLAYLDLSHNPIEMLTIENLLKLPNLNSLNLSSTNIREVKRNTFSLNDGKIEKLDLSHNNLNLANFNIFQYVPTLRSLHVQENILELMNYTDIRKYLPNLEEIEYDIGDLKCDFAVDFRNFLEQYQIKLIIPSRSNESAYRKCDFLNYVKTMHKDDLNADNVSERKIGIHESTIEERISLTLLVIITIMVSILLIINFPRCRLNYFLRLRRNSPTTYFTNLNHPSRLDEETDSV